jgi:hypothetical protein
MSTAGGSISWRNRRLERKADPESKAGDREPVTDIVGKKEGGPPVEGQVQGRIADLIINAEHRAQENICVMNAANGAKPERGSEPEVPLQAEALWMEPWYWYSRSSCV